MKRIVTGLLVASLASCGSTAKQSATTTTTGAGSGAGSGSSAGNADVVAAAFKSEVIDQGQIGHYVGDRMIGAEEFKVERNALGYRITSRYESRQGRTELELITDVKGATIGGTLTAKIPGPPPEAAGSAAPLPEFALTSTMSRDGHGNLVSQFNNGRSVETTASKRPVDWFIGGPFLAILLPICGVTTTETTSFLIFPDDTIDIFAATTIALDGKRTISVRRARFASSGKSNYIACEGGKIVGHRAGKLVSARRDDAAVQVALAKLPD